ncbi:MAG: acyl-CoA dehydrogenase, partial [Gammaproteobacteria bacterium]|nr:acyl-CoA dehydrogenase [Gammaproteobacteria bacterium]
MIAAAWALVYLRAPLWIWTTLALVALASWTAFGKPALPVLSIAWGVFVLLAVPLNLTPLRRRLISDHLLRLFRAIMPAMSQTEREALEAGTVGWDGELFSGRPRWKKLRAWPAPALSAAEQAFLDGPVEELCRRLDDWRITHEDYDLPPEMWRFIKDHGLFGMIIPRRYGGLEFSALAHSSVVIKIASRSMTAAVTVMVPNSLGPAELLLHYGTEQQKSHYLPRLARGEEIPCFALTAPDAGSDAASMPDNGVICRGSFQGKDIIGIRINWEKRYITLGPVATVLGLAFKLYDPDHLLGDKEELGITLALIPTHTPGISIGRRHMPLNATFQNGPNSGTDVFIPLDWIIGGPERIGQGWRMLMETLAAGRSISLPALSTGAGKLACRATGAYARVREQFKTPIGYFEGVEEALARMAATTYMMDAARLVTASAVDRGERPAVISAIVKYQLTEAMRRVINDAMDIQGGSGICMGPRNLLGRAYQALPISITVEGANILTRSLIIFGQGAVRCHPFVLKEMQAVADTDPRRASKNFDHALFGHIGFTLSNAARALFLGLTGARLSPAPGAGRVRRHYQHLTRMSAAFALTADVAMLTLGAALKRKEKLSGRLADALSHLYLASTVLRHFQDQGQLEADLPLVQWSCENALHHVQLSLDGVLHNLPNRFAARALRLLVFPLGKPYAPPGDVLGHAVARRILEPSEARDRLTAGIFAPTGP